MLHTFTQANLHLHPLSLRDMAAEVVPGQDRRDSSGNGKRTPGSGRMYPRHRRYSSGRPKPSKVTKTIILAAPNYLPCTTQKSSCVRLRPQHLGVQIVNSRQCQWTQRPHPTAPGAAQASRQQSQMTPANSGRRLTRFPWKQEGQKNLWCKAQSQNEHTDDQAMVPAVYFED